MSENKFRLEFSMDSTAFADYGDDETKRVLGAIVERIGCGDEAGLVKDFHGNTIGFWEMTGPSV